MNSARSFSVFAVVFAAVYAVMYVIAMEKNYALFTYHPALEKFGFLVQKPEEGPAMYWYGWIATAGIVALAAGLLACAIPERAQRRLWSGWAWTIPLSVIVVLGYLLRGYFTR